VTPSGPGENEARLADEVARSSAHLYSGIVEWYVQRFFDDLEDADWLDTLVRRLPPSSLILDVGAGPGNFARFLARNGCTTISSDIAVEMVRASQVLVPECPTVVADMRSLPFRGESFDGILCAYSLMHIPAGATPGVLAEFTRMLRPAGVLQLMIKTGSGAYQFRSGLVEDARGFVQLWELEEFLSLVEESGCSIEDVQKKQPSSPHEFDYPKVMILASANGRRVRESPYPA